MAISYDNLLTQEQKKAILESRIQQFAADIYQTELNREIHVRAGNEDAVAGSDESIAFLKTAIDVHQEELSKTDSE